MDIDEESEIENIKALNEKYPFINWDLYFKKLLDYYGIHDVVNDDILINNKRPNLLKQFNEIFSVYDYKTLSTFMKW